MLGTARNTWMSKAPKSRWTHESVYRALVKRGARVKESTYDSYVVLYPQASNCAILYRPESKKHRASPLHLHPGRRDWRSGVYSAILPALESVTLQKGAKRLLYCRVADWARFAKALGID